MDDLIKEFSDYLRIEKRNSPNTISAYRSDLKRFYAEISGTLVDSLTTADIRKFLIKLKNQGLSTATIARNLSSIKSFYKYLGQNSQLKNNPAEILESPKKLRKLPYILSLNDVDILLTRYVAGCVL